MSPRLSIITVIYNSKTHLESTLDNLLHQNYPNLELILIDGGSTDGTLDVIKRYEDQIQTWVSEPDQGIYDAMNKGMQLATGAWVSFINAGDGYQEANTLSGLEGYFNDSELDLIYGKTAVLREGEQDFIIGKATSKDAIEREFSCHQAFFFRRSLLEAVGPYHLEYQIAADLDLVIRCFQKARKSIFIDDVINYYDGSGVSSQNFWNNYLEGLKIRWQHGLLHKPANIYRLLDILARYCIKRALGRV